jgi:TRAP-type C4-dicarboxylate transport system permease small subunit
MPHPPPRASVAASVGSALGTLAGVVLAGIMMVTVIDVFGRYVLNRPLPGSTELTEVMMAILIYAGLPVVSERSAHVSVDLFSSATPAAVSRIRDAIVRLVCAVVLAIVSWRLWAYAEQIRASKDVTEYLRLPQAPFAFGMSVLAGSAALLELYRAVSPAPPRDGFDTDTA